MNDQPVAPAAAPLLELSVPAPNSALMTGAQAAEAFAQALEVSDDESYAFADTQLADLKGKANRLDEERRAIVDPINAGVKRINDLFRPAREFYERAEKAIKDKMLGYHQKRDQERRDAEAAAQRQADQEQQQRETAALKASEEAVARGDAEGAQRALEDAVTPAPLHFIAAPPPPRAAASSVKKVWTAEGQDIDACIKAAAAGNRNARACLTWNTTDMGARAKALKADFVVPGVLVREVPTMSTRATR